MEGTVIEKKETVDVIGLDGKPQNPATGPLADMFDKIEAGKEEGKSAAQVVKETPVVDPKITKTRDPDTGQFVKPVEKPVEKKEVKSDLDKKLETTIVPEKKEEPTDLRSALKKATETTTLPEKKEDKPDPTEEVPAEELKVLETDKPKTAKRIQALLKKIESTSGEVAKTRAERDDKAQKLAELEKKLSEVKTVDPKTDEEIKKQLDELSMYRRRYELDNDPEVKTRFEGRIAAAEQSIVDTLKRKGAGDGLLKLIQEEGGWAGFASSSRLVSIPDGDGGTKQVSTAELAEAVLGQLPLGERKAVEAAMLEQATTKRDRERFFKDEQAKANDYFKQRDEQARKLSESNQKQVEEAKKAIDDWRRSVEAQDWIKDKEVPANASAQQKAEIEEYNHYNGQLRSLITQAVNVKDLNGMLDLVHDAVRYYDERRTSASLRRENERLKADLEAKSNELTKFKKAGSSVPRGGSIAVTPTPEDRPQKRPVGLEAALSRIEESGREALSVNE